MDQDSNKKRTATVTPWWPLFRLAPTNGRQMVWVYKCLSGFKSIQSGVTMFEASAKAHRRCNACAMGMHIAGLVSHGMSALMSMHGTKRRLAGNGLFASDAP